MPCYDSRDDEDKARNAQLVTEQAKQIDKLTDMLCSICSKHNFEELPQDVRGWYSRHIDNDRKRVYNLFVDKFTEFSEKVKDISGDQLRRVEELLDQIK